MVNRFWDKENRWPEGFLKEYTHWILEIHYRQSTLGCFLIFSKRPVERISELEDEEICELKEVMREMERTLSTIEIFKPDRFNYMQLGNQLHNLHFHGFPRYKQSRQFDGKEWVDADWRELPEWASEESSHELVAKIRDAIKPHLP